ncbi:nucleotide exchange factor GrpE [bacterium]|jgi:molecular chaperone GrpE|nr:nucleotide exchange factor GrpE [bacterium]
MVENKNEQTVADTEQTSTQALEACQAEVAAWKDRCMRTMADFQNYQQRSEKERVLWMDKAQERVLKDVLSLFDDVDRALQEIQKQDVSSVQAFVAGLELLHKQTVKVLEKYGVKEFAAYEQFDPELHEAITFVSAQGKQSGFVVDVFQKGFMYKDQVLRIAKVSVAQ